MTQLATDINLAIATTPEDCAKDLAGDINLALGWRAADPRYPYDGTVTLRARGVSEVVRLTERNEQLLRAAKRVCERNEELRSQLAALNGHDLTLCGDY